MSAFKRIKAVINLANAEHNFREIQRFCNGADIIAVVKADAYGHGAKTLGALYEKLGAKILAVACLNEAIELRQSGITCPIMILGYTPPESVPFLIENDIIQTVFSLSYAEELSRAAAPCKKNLTVHIKTDTGMTRLGVYAHRGFYTNAADEIQKIFSLKNLSVEGIFTHFAEADSDDKHFTDEQFESFSQTVSELSRRGIAFKFCHCANSAGVVNYKKAHLGCVRPGLALYGLFPGEHNEDIDLRPVMSLISTVADVRDIRKGDTISYGRNFTAPRDMRIAIVSAGYADGVPRSLSGRASFLINGQRVPVLGNICMDLFIADASALPLVSRGDEVVIFGEQGELSISADEIASLAGTISYEILTSVSRRVTRTYIRSNA